MSNLLEEVHSLLPATDHLQRRDHPVGGSVARKVVGPES